MANFIWPWVPNDYFSGQQGAVDTKKKEQLLGAHVLRLVWISYWIVVYAQKNQNGFLHIHHKLMRHPAHVHTQCTPSLLPQLYMLNLLLISIPLYLYTT